MSLIFFAKVARISPRYKMHLVGGLRSEAYPSGTSSQTNGQRKSRALDPAFFIPGRRHRGDAYASEGASPLLQEEIFPTGRVIRKILFGIEEMVLQELHHPFFPVRRVNIVWIAPFSVV